MKKKVVILWHNGGRLANQLWLYSNLLAYSFEKNIEIVNLSFFEYNKYFKINNNNSFFVYLRSILGVFITRQVYKVYITLIYLFNFRKCIKISPGNEILLPPSTNDYPDLFHKLENGKLKIVYTYGWGYRNPTGMSKYKDKIIDYLFIKDVYKHKADKLLKVLRKDFKHIVGVHIRQGDYKKINNDIFTYFDENQVKNFLNEYLIKNETTTCCFVVVSDGKIDVSKLNNNTFLFTGNPIEDLYLLSKTDIIIGSNSTFGTFAAYYGNIKHVLFSKKGLVY